MYALPGPPSVGLGGEGRWVVIISLSTPTNAKDEWTDPELLYNAPGKNPSTQPQRYLILDILEDFYPENDHLHQPAHPAYACSTSNTKSVFGSTLPAFHTQALL